MKKSDIATIILIAGFSAIVAFVLSNVLLGDVSEESVRIQYLDVISGDIAEPDEELFNAHAINPTVEVYVGQCTEAQIWDSQSNICIDKPDDSEDSNEEEDTNEEDTGDEDTGNGETEDESTDQENTDEQAPTD